MTVRILQGDARDVLRTLPDGSVHCVVTSPPYFGLRSYLPAGHPDKPREIGSEPTLSQFVSIMVGVFREVRRVLRPDGACLLNLGDGYTADGQLLGVPWRVAFALQDDGWRLRRDLIWDKPSVMPESVTDRCTTSHEYVFHLTKNRASFWDAEAIAEPVSGTAHARGSGVNPKATNNAKGARQNSSFSAAVAGLVSSRNARSVWRIPVEPCREAHFATMGPGVAKRCIMAAASEVGCCSACGSPWERVIAKGDANKEWQRASGADSSGGYSGRSTKGHKAAGVQDASDVKRRILAGMREKITSAWQMTCHCPLARPVPCTVLDPFGGAGTTGLVADRLGRDAILIELNADYCAMAERRLRDDAPLFAEVGSE